MKSRKGQVVSLLTGMLLVLAVTAFAPSARATTITCGLFDSMDEPGAIHWPVNGHLYYCGNNYSNDASCVSVVWNAAQGSTQRVVGAQVVPFLRQVFTNTRVDIYVFDTLSDFNQYFGVNIAPSPGASTSDIVGFTARPGQIAGHPAPLTAIFQHAPAINSSSLRLLMIAETTNHQLGHQMDRYYGYPSTRSANYFNALNLDIASVNKLTCLEVFGSLAGNACVPGLTNWQRMQRLWPSDAARADEFFANVFAADSPSGALNPILGAIIRNDFTNTVNYERGLRTGTGKP
jgi:hypothetical protein